MNQQMTMQQNNTDNKIINRTKISRKQKWQEKTTVLAFQETNTGNILRENSNMAKKGNLKRETESILIVSQNNAIWTNYEDH